MIWGIIPIPLSGPRSSSSQLLGVLVDGDSQLSPTPGTGLSQNGHLTQGHTTFLGTACIQLWMWGISSHLFCLRIRQLKRVIAASERPVGLAETCAEILSTFSSSLPNPTSFTLPTPPSSPVVDAKSTLKNILHANLYFRVCCSSNIM